jgi:hypothetical protein
MLRAMAQRVHCDICNAVVGPHGHYIVRMEVFADPSIPEMSTEELEEMDPDESFAKLLEQMQGMTAEDLQDQVHRRFEFKLCSACQKRFLANPLGLPRKLSSGEN